MLTDWEKLAGEISPGAWRAIRRVLIRQLHGVDWRWMEMNGVGLGQGRQRRGGAHLLGTSQA